MLLRILSLLLCLFTFLYGRKRFLLWILTIIIFQHFMLSRLLNHLVGIVRDFLRIVLLLHPLVEFFCPLMLVLLWFCMLSWCVLLTFILLITHFQEGYFSHGGKGITVPPALLFDFFPFFLLLSFALSLSCIGYLFPSIQSSHLGEDEESSKCSSIAVLPLSKL